MAGRYVGRIPDYRGAESGGRHYARHTVCRIHKVTVYPRVYNLPSRSSRNARQPGPLNGIPGVPFWHVMWRRVRKELPGWLMEQCRHFLPAYISTYQAPFGPLSMQHTCVPRTTRLAEMPGDCLACLEPLKADLRALWVSFLVMDIYEN